MALHCFESAARVIQRAEEICKKSGVPVEANFEDVRALAISFPIDRQRNQGGRQSMTTSQFLKIRSALVTASILAGVGVQKATTVAQTKYYRRSEALIDEGLRTIDSPEGERTDQPRQKQLAMEVAH